MANHACRRQLPKWQRNAGPGSQARLARAGIRSALPLDDEVTERDKPIRSGLEHEPFGCSISVQSCRRLLAIDPEHKVGAIALQEDVVPGFGEE